MTENTSLAILCFLLGFLAAFVLFIYSGIFVVSEEFKEYTEKVNHHDKKVMDNCEPWYRCGLFPVFGIITISIITAYMIGGVLVWLRQYFR